jgi:predicted ester cyclase
MVRATHKGAYEGVPATGKQIAVGALHVIRVKNGRIAEWWAAEDDLGTYRQIGMVIKPPSATP